MNYLLDTSICVFFLRGRFGLSDLIKEKGREKFYISEITVAELYYGAENSNHPAKSIKSVEAFVSGLTVLPIWGAIGRYAKEKTRLRKAGKLIHDDFDLLIEATALANKLILITDNVKDFERLDGIKIENWIDR